MPTFKIRATVVTFASIMWLGLVSFEVEVEANSLEEAIETVTGQYNANVTHYAIEGVLGWNKVEEI